MKNIGALVPVRLASERLPGKAIKEICGKPVICHLLDRIFQSRFLDRQNVVVCTTKEKSDDPLVKVVKNYGASVFRGSRDDIIERFYDAMNSYNLDYVIQIDGDDPTSEPIYMDLTMQYLLENEDIDIVTVKNLPLGLATKSFSLKGLEKVYSNYKSKSNDTGFILLFTKSGLCNHHSLSPISPDHINTIPRLTLDYEEDFEFFTELFKHLYVEGSVFGIDDIMSLLSSSPEVFDINQGLNDLYWERTKEKTDLEFYSPEGEVRKISI